MYSVHILYYIIVMEIAKNKTFYETCPMLGEEIIAEPLNYYNNSASV